MAKSNKVTLLSRNDDMGYLTVWVKVPFVRSEDMAEEAAAVAMDRAITEALDEWVIPVPLSDFSRVTWERQGAVSELHSMGLICAACVMSYNQVQR